MIFYFTGLTSVLAIAIKAKAKFYIKRIIKNNIIVGIFFLLFGWVERNSMFVFRGFRHSLYT